MRLSKSAVSFASVAVLLAAMGALGAGGTHAQHSAGASGPYRVQRRVAIGGEGGWDMLTYDAAHRRLFVTHATRVEVVDVAAGKVVGAIPDLAGVHGVALASKFGCGFTSNGRDSSVTVFSLDSLGVLAKITLPARGPDEIVYDDFSEQVFAFCGGSSSVVAIDPRGRIAVANVPLGGKPEFAVTDGAGRMFVNLEDSSAVVVLDTRTLRTIARWPLAPGEGPSGIALDRKHHRLFSACSNQKLIVLDSESGKFVTEVPIGRGVDGAAFDARQGLVFAPAGADSSLGVIHEDAPDQYSVQNITTERGARTLALDESSGTVYLPTSDFGPPPPPTADRPNPRPSIAPGTFRVLVVGR